MKVSVSSRVPGPLPSISKIQPRKAEGPGNLSPPCPRYGFLPVHGGPEVNK